MAGPGVTKLTVVHGGFEARDRDLPPGDRRLAVDRRRASRRCSRPARRCRRAPERRCPADRARSHRLGSPGVPSRAHRRRMERPAFRVSGVSPGWNRGRPDGRRCAPVGTLGVPARRAPRVRRGARRRRGATAVPYSARLSLGRRRRRLREPHGCGRERRVAGRGTARPAPPIRQRHDDRDRHEHERRDVRDDHRPVRESTARTPARR